MIPTRIDVLPYKISPFMAGKEDDTATIDLLKILLVVYTIYVVRQNYVQVCANKNTLGKFLEVISPSNFWENFTDIIVIILQTYCFFIKLQDSQAFERNPNEQLLLENFRKKFQSIFFYAVNFRDY